MCKRRQIFRQLRTYLIQWAKSEIHLSPSVQILGLVFMSWCSLYWLKLRQDLWASCTREMHQHLPIQFSLIRSQAFSRQQIWILVTKVRQAAIKKTYRLLFQWSITKDSLLKIHKLELAVQLFKNQHQSPLQTTLPQQLLTTQTSVTLTISFLWVYRSLCKLRVSFARQLIGTPKLPIHRSQTATTEQ